MSFEGKVVIITGSSTGIGASTAIKFADEGANVVLLGKNEEKLENMSKQFGKKSLVLELDISNDDKTKNVLDKIFNHFGKIDVLVNKASTGSDIDIMSEDFMEDYDRNIKVNLRSAVYLTHLAIPYLIKSKGNIINVSSIGENVNIGVHGAIPYCISKAGLNQFSRCIATQLAPYGIRVNTVSPGPVKTDTLINSSVSKHSSETMAATTLLNRVSEPAEITDIILYLASDKAKGITGSEFIIDNGATLKN